MGLLDLLALAVAGFIVGGLGRLALPGRDPMPIWKTILIGLAGSALAGLVWIVFDLWGGIVLAVAFATLIVYLIRRSRGGSVTDPGVAP